MIHPALEYSSLEEAMRNLGGPANMLRNSTLGAYYFPVVMPEYSNWQDEQRAWMNDVALLNLSYHMTHLYLRGPDVLRFLKRVSCTKLGDFPVNRGKQLIVASPDGYFIGDNIAFHTADGLYRFSGPPSVTNWLQYQLEIGDFDIRSERDDSQNARSGDPLIYTYQIQGPNALPLMRDVCDGAFPEIKFFHIGEFTIGGKQVRALRHGMAGVPGFELFGPWSDSASIMAALEKAGAKYRLRKVGGRAYPSTCLESGWMALPAPAIYHGEELRPYREWMKPWNLEVLGSIGGSFFSDNIMDYYMDPVEIGYGPFLDLEVDCIGRDALVEKLNNQKRKKVTLVWDQDDVAKIMRASVFPTESPAKYLELPLGIYSTFHYDAVMKDGQLAGVSNYCGVSANAREFLSLAIIDIAHSEPGTEVEVLWGEPESHRPTVEKNVMHKARAKVAPMPYFVKSNKSS